MRWDKCISVSGRIVIRFISIYLLSLKPSTHIASTPQEAASRGKTLEMDTCLAPCACLVWRQPRGESTPVGFWRAQRCLASSCSLWLDCRACSFKMDNEKCRLLIDLYKDHRSLWDPEHKDYHNSTRREDSWKYWNSVIDMRVKFLTISSTDSNTISCSSLFSYCNPFLNNLLTHQRGLSRCSFFYRNSCTIFMSEILIQDKYKFSITRNSH
jgi:hypothetical protein